MNTPNRMKMDFGKKTRSIWFAIMLGLIGYIAGNVVPLRKLFK